MVICVVIRCSNRSDRNKQFSYHRIPVVMSYYREREFELSVKQRSAFLAAISRENIDVDNLEKYRICSRHFVNGKPAKTLDETNIGWVPTIHLGHQKRQKCSWELDRYEKARRRHENQQQQEKQNTLYIGAV